MKILFIHNKYKIEGGEDRVFKNEIDLIKKYGHEVETVVFNNKKVNSFSAKIKAAIFSIYNPFSSSRIKKIIAEFKPDLIHVHNFFPLVSPSVFFKTTRKKIPVVMTLHNYRLICANAVLFRKGEICEKCINKRFPLKGILYRCYRNSLIETLILVFTTSFHNLIGTWKTKVDRYIALSEFQRDKILYSSIGIEKSRVVVKPNFVPDSPVEVSNVKKDFFLYVGRLEMDKGVDTLLNAFKNSTQKLKILGEGGMKSEVVSVCDKFENMEYLGIFDNKKVINILRSAKALIFPSKTYEGFPMVIAEAFACGTPVISSDIGSQSEIVKNGYNGFHFRMNDPNDLNDKLTKITDASEGFAENVRKTHENLYSEKENLRILIKIYEDLL